MPQIAPLSWMIIPFFIFFLLVVLFVNFWWVNKSFYFFSSLDDCSLEMMVWKW